MVKLIAAILAIFSVPTVVLAVLWREPFVLTVSLPVALGALLTLNWR